MIFIVMIVYYYAKIIVYHVLHITNVNFVDNPFNWSMEYVYLPVEIQLCKLDLNNVMMEMILNLMVVTNVNFNVHTVVFYVRIITFVYNVILNLLN